MTILMAAIVIAPPVPAPVSGKVILNGETLDGYGVEVTNVNTGEILTQSEVPTLKTENGLFMFDLSSFEQGYQIKQRATSGDLIKIVACPHADCVYSFEIVDTSPLHVPFDVSSDDVIVYKCYDGSSVSNEADCPKEPEPEVITQYKCPDGSEVNDLSLCDSCDEAEGDTVFAVIASVLSGLLGLGVGGFFIKRKEALSKGVGIKIYTKRDGSEGVFHKHPGITGYHSPYTSHREEIERHPRGELTPKYEKNSDGIWAYVK